MEQGHAVVVVNVGGKRFTTSRSSLLCDDGFFGGLAQHHDFECGSELFVDRDPTHFRHILNWMRGSFTTPFELVGMEALLSEALFYSMTEFANAVSVKISNMRRSTTQPRLSKLSQRIAK